MNPRQVIGRLYSRRALLVVAAVLAVWAAAGFLVLPYFLRPFVERKISEGLHRPAILRRLSLNPFALSVTMNGLEVKNRGGAGPFFSIDRLYMNLEAVSIFRGGPVIRMLTLTKPSLTIDRKS